MDNRQRLEATSRKPRIVMGEGPRIVSQLDHEDPSRIVIWAQATITICGTVQYFRSTGLSTDSEGTAEYLDGIGREQRAELLDVLHALGVENLDPGPPVVA